MLATAAGFEIEKVEYDSNNYVIWCSEQYLKGIPLHADRKLVNESGKKSFYKRKNKRISEKDNESRIKITTAIQQPIT